MKESVTNEDYEVDITTVEKDSALSDSDISQEELSFLPADPCPDVFEKQQEKRNSKLGGSNSPLSEETGGIDGMNQESSLLLEGNFFSTLICTRSKELLY